MVHWVEALRYKPESRGFDSRWGNWNFSLAVALVSIHLQAGVTPGGIKATGTYGGQLYQLHEPKV